MKLDKYLGKPIEGSFEKYLEANKNSENQKPETKEKPATKNIQNGNEYLILPGRKHENYEYPDLLVARKRTHQGESWNQAHDSLKQENSLMLTTRQFVDFLNMLKSGRAYDGNGKLTDKSKLDEILDEIITVRKPERAERLDAKFSSQGIIRKQFYITYYKIDNGRLVETTEELHQDTLMDDKSPGIDLDYLINVDATHQGLPPKNIAQGKLHYWHPRNGAVAWFWAYSGRAGLFCFRGPGNSFSSLGVRAAKIR